MAMPRTQTMVQLSDELLAVLDEAASRRGTSRSALIRSAIERFLTDDAEAVVTRQIVEGYRRTPQARPEEWGDLRRHGDDATAEVLRRLDAEERDAGHGPW